MPRTALLLAILSAALAFVPLTSSRAGSVPTPECQRDLLVADSDIRESQNRLGLKSTAATKELCPLWRQHVDVAHKAASVYRRCLTGTDQRVRVADTNSSAADFEQALKSSCR